MQNRVDSSFFLGTIMLVKIEQTSSAQAIYINPDLVAAIFIREEVIDSTHMTISFVGSSGEEIASVAATEHDRRYLYSWRDGILNLINRKVQSD